MTGKKDFNQNLQIRAYPSNPCHPCSIRFDEHYFFNPNNHAQNPTSSISVCHICASVYEIINQQIKLIQRSRFGGHNRKIMEYFRKCKIRYKNISVFSESPWQKIQYVSLPFPSIKKARTHFREKLGVADIPFGIPASNFGFSL